MARSPLYHEAIGAHNAGNLVLALQLMEDAARQGDPVACFEVALWYSGTDGMPADKARSKQWLVRFEQLAEDGDPEAQWEVGQNYRFGNLLPQNTKRANYWLERSAEGGCGEAQHHLASFLRRGAYGYPVDEDASEMWYRRAFEQDHPETLYLFALRKFEDGRPTDEAIRLLKKAAEKGFDHAKCVLASYMH